jgi:hypothetical protein
MRDPIFVQELQTLYNDPFNRTLGLNWFKTYLKQGLCHVEHLGDLPKENHGPGQGNDVPPIRTELEVNIQFLTNNWK